MEASAPVKMAKDPTRSPAETKSRCSDISPDRPKAGVGHCTSVPSALSRAAEPSDSPNRHVALGPPESPAARPAAGNVTGMVMVLSQPTAVPDGAAREASIAMTRRTMAGYSRLHLGVYHGK